MFEYCKLVGFKCPMCAKVGKHLYCGQEDKGHNKIDLIIKCPLPAYKPKDSMHGGTVRKYQRGQGRSTCMVGEIS